ncbi:MAG: hypothetical protein WCA20_15285 [Candidatus Sulfotelmatobacter sp.]
MPSRPDQAAELKFVVTNTLIVRDIQRSVAFYRDVLVATVLRAGEPTFLRFGNIGGGPTDDKPDVIASPPRDENVLSSFLNLRVTDIRHYYELWSSRGAAVGLAEVRKAYDAVFAAIRLTVKFNIAEIVEMSPDWVFARTNSAGTTLNQATRAVSKEGNQELFLFHKE